MPTPDEYRRKLKSTFWHSTRQSGCMERANRAANPAYLRLADLATAFAAPNGHAEFGPGELAECLGVKDSRTVDKAINRAVEYHLLADGSHKRCLQIPLTVFTPYAGGGGQHEQDRRRARPCATCHDHPSRPSACHPDRERYTSVRLGSLCQSCYRRAQVAGASKTA